MNSVFQKLWSHRSEPFEDSNRVLRRAEPK